MKKLIEELQAYLPCNAQEKRDRETLLAYLNLEALPDPFTRENPIAHLTASAWVTDSSHSRILMAYHNLYRSWSWLGGHADGEHDLRLVAEKEVREESGLRTLRLLTPEIFSLEILTVDGHEKRGQYVTSHLHLNLTYLFEADPSEPVRCKPDENAAVTWFPREEAVSHSSEPWFRERIYAKLNEKLLRF